MRCVAVVRVCSVKLKIGIKRVNAMKGIKKEKSRGER